MTPPIVAPVPLLVETAPYDEPGDDAIDEDLEVVFTDEIKRR